MAELQAHDVSRPGERMSVDINLRRAALFDPATGKAM
jgi:multiple sugar transport system ATP-binding protein